MRQRRIYAVPLLEFLMAVQGFTNTEPSRAGIDSTLGCHADFVTASAVEARARMWSGARMGTETCASDRLRGWTADQAGTTNTVAIEALNEPTGDRGHVERFFRYSFMQVTALSGGHCVYAQHQAVGDNTALPHMQAHYRLSSLAMQMYP